MKHCLGGGATLAVSVRHHFSFFSCRSPSVAVGRGRSCFYEVLRFDPLDKKKENENEQVFFLSHSPLSLLGRFLWAPSLGSGLQKVYLRYEIVERVKSHPYLRQAVYIAEDKCCNVCFLKKYGLRLSAG